MTEEAASNGTALGADDLRLRRRHAASGVVALGSFLVLHLVVQATALGGAATWERVAGALARSTAVSMATVVLVLFPLAFHFALGVALARRPIAAEDIAHYGSARRARAQRWGGLALLVFVVVHAWALAGPRAFLGLPASASHTLLEAHLSSTWAGLPFAALGTILGVALACFYVVNGAHAASRIYAPGSGPRLRTLATVVGAVLFIVGSASVIGIATGAGAIAEPALPAAPCGPAAQ